MTIECDKGCHLSFLVGDSRSVCNPSIIANDYTKGKGDSSSEKRLPVNWMILWAM